MADVAHGRRHNGKISFAPLPKGEDLGAAVIAAIDAAAKAKQAAQPRRTYLGGSMLGWPCDRQLAYYYHQTPQDPGREIDGRIARLFSMGHHLEPLIVTWLQDAGYEVHVGHDDGSQYGWSIDEGRIKGHIDGAATAGPVGRFPCLLEFKGLKAAKWKKVVADGLRAARWEYFVQVQIYMQQMELTQFPCMWIAVNKDTQELYIEFIKFEPEVAAEHIGRGMRIVRTTRPEQADRVARDQSDYRCKFCDWRERCWSEKTARPRKTNKPDWLSRGAGVASVAT